MPSLRELDARFLKNLGNGGSQKVETLSEADGIIFLCPKCFATNGGKVKTHSVICWFVGKVPDDLGPKPGRWNPQGTGLDDLTFVPPGAVSVRLTGGCGWHGHVVSGAAA